MLHPISLHQRSAVQAEKLVCALQERSEDLQVFVEVLQTLTPEPEDLMRLRASEAALRQKVARLEASLEGHHLQQTISKLQQAEVNITHPCAYMLPFHTTHPLIVICC